MRSTGIIKKADRLGKIVLPKELRDTLGIKIIDDEANNVDSYVEIYIDEGMIVIGKHKPFCIFCRETDNVQKLNDKLVCNGCLDELRKMI